MKIDLSDIGTALDWLMKNTNDDHVIVEFDHQRIYLSAVDRLGKHVKITIYQSGTIKATITHTEPL